MTATSAPLPKSRLVQWGPGAGAALLGSTSGAVYGLALARFLFELDPLRFSLFGSWPAVLLSAAAALAVGLALGLALRRLDAARFPLAGWAPLSLALPIFALLPPDINQPRSLTLLAGAWALLVLFAMAPPAHQADPAGDGTLRPRRADAFYPLLLFAFLFALYLRTLAPAVGQADTFEFQVDVARLGIAHGSGYPLLMLVGRLFTLLPVGGTLAFRANLSSAFFAALAAVGVERIARRLGAGPLVALLAGLAFGVSPTLWSRAVEIEVFALNAAFVATILYLCLDIVAPLPPAGGVGATRYQTASLQRRLMLVAFIFGLSLTNHLTTLFLAPACLLAAAVAIQRRRRTGSPGIANTVHKSASSVLRRSSFVLLAFLLGLSVYLYIPLRWPAVNGGQSLSLAGFANILTGNEAKGAFNWRLPFQDPGRYAIVWGKIVGEYGWAGLALALLGIASLLWPILAVNRQSPSTAGPPQKPIVVNSQLPIANYIVLLLFFITVLGYAYFALAFNVPDPSFSSYLIPVHLITAVLMALGVQWLLNLAAQCRPAAAFRPLVASLVLGGFCLFGLRSVWTTFPLVDRSGDWAEERLGEFMLSQPLAQGAAILADSEKIAPLEYLQVAGGRRPDLDIIVLPDEASYRAALDERLAAGQVVYLGRYLPGLSGDYSLRSIGPLVEVSPVPFENRNQTGQPPMSYMTKSGISLLGYATSTGISLYGQAPGSMDLTLLWLAGVVPTDNLLVNLRLVDGTGRTGWQSAGSVPVNGLYPTNAWRVGETISDFYWLPVSASLPPGNYQVQVALAPPFAPISDTAWSAVAPVTIVPPVTSPTPPHLLRDSFGPNWLLGYDIPSAVAPGSHYSVTLYWLRSATVSAVTGLGETRSLAAWPPGAVVPVTYSRVAPAQGDSIQLAVGAGAPARCGWLAPISQDCALPAIQLAGQAAAEGAVNFDNQILLNKAQLATLSAVPGQGVTVNLEWQALRAISSDYTVFVHLLGPDGLVHGQIDRWPVSGTRATSGWAPGERIADPYTVPLPADAPPGAYHVEIGLYLLATGERLPVLNADGAPVDDRLLLAGPQVTRP